MAIKHILVPLTGHGDATHTVTTAMKLARRFKAHVTATPAGYEANPYLDPTGVNITPAYYDELIRALEKAAGHARAQARQQFDVAVRAARVANVDKPPCATASTYWYDNAALAGTDAVLTLGPLSDLIVVHRGQSIADRDVIEDALFGARRPVLVMPPKVSEIGKTAALAWNGGAECINVLERAVDLLEPGAKVTIIQVGKLLAGALPASAAADYLGWHGFEATVREVTERSKATAQIIQRESHAAGAGLLVMGAYSHSRLREALLGGVTEFMLKQATIPLLLSH
jgi:nucleotide-binding universal stress UspA family protein